MPSPIFIQPYVDWDADAIIDAAGGAAGLRRLLENHRFPVPESDTIYMWRNRGRIPGRWVPTVVYVLLKEKRIAFQNLLRLRRAGTATQP